MLVVRSKVKEVAKGMNVASDFADALSDVLAAYIAEAETRCHENKRSTLMDKDLSLVYQAPKKVKDVIVVRSKIKETSKKCNVGSSFADALNRVAHWHVQKAMQRSADNKRSTIQPRDL